MVIKIWCLTYGDVVCLVMTQKQLNADFGYESSMATGPDKQKIKNAYIDVKETGKELQIIDWETMASMYDEDFESLKNE